MKINPLKGKRYSLPLLILGLLVLSPSASLITTHFNSNELNQPGCTAKREFVERLEVARKLAGIPFFITSGCRTPQHNQLVGGVKNSAHLRGWAVDIFVSSSKERGRILQALYQVGFRRVGIGSNFIHVDADPLLPSPRTWLYP